MNKESRRRITRAPVAGRPFKPLPAGRRSAVAELLPACFLILLLEACGVGYSYIRPGEPLPVHHTARGGSPRPADSLYSPGDTGSGASRDSARRDEEAGTAVYTIYLLGDAGYADSSNSAPLDAVERKASENPGHSLVAYLGDNVYTNGMPPKGDPQRHRAERILTRQLDVIARSGAKGVLIPGNHDWAGMGEGGAGSVVYQQEFVNEYTASHPGARIDFIPPRAEPGPAVLLENDIFRVIALDAQWWLHQYDKPLYPGTATMDETAALFADSLKRLTDGYDGVTILLAHNPLETHGPHGGYFTWKDHLFPLTNVVPWLWIPLPVLGSVYPVARMNGFSPQDVSNDMYRRYISTVTSALDSSGPVIVASGHEHALQVIHVSDNILNLVSGSGILNHSSAVTAGENTLFASEMAGYMVVDIYIDGSVRLRVMGVRDAASAPELLYSRLLVEKNE